MQKESKRRTEDALERVRVLSDALPNIQKFRGASRHCPFIFIFEIDLPDTVMARRRYPIPIATGT